MNSILIKVLKDMTNLNNVKPISVTKEQYETLDAMVVAYMAVASLNLDQETLEELMAPMDAAWDNLVIKQQEQGDIYEP